MDEATRKPDEADDAILRGDAGAAARLMRSLDDELPAARECLRRLFPHTGRARALLVNCKGGALRRFRHRQKSCPRQDGYANRGNERMLHTR